MISKVVRSELILNRRAILYNAAMLVAMAVAYALLLEGPGAVLAVAVIIVPAQAVPLVRASKFRADATACALPVTRDQLVAGKLLAVLVVMAVGFALVLGVALVAPHPGFTTAEVLHPDRLATLVLLMALVSSLLAPLMLRFGFLGILVLVLGLNLLTVIVFVLTAAGVIRSALDFLFRDLPRAAAGFREAAGFPGFHLGALAAACLSGYLSLKVSQRVYRRREL